MKSNCLLETLKAKAISPFDNEIHKKGSWRRIFKRQWPHFYWYHKPLGKYYGFEPRTTILSWMGHLWYRGDIVEFVQYENEINREEIDNE